uniref:Potassium transporter n=1 Tax=Fagus sylvatica TaxID=28930 RepID=A0A2N9EBY7_FAGSY
MTSEVAPKSPERSMDQVYEELNGKRILRRFDSLDLESSTVPGRHGHASKAAGWSVILHLAFQSIGIVYGDIGTSPLYVYASTFTNGIKHNDDILGVLSLIFYTLTLIPLVKYVFIVLKATDNGEGGTFALYSLICRYAKVGLIPNQQAEDREVSNFQLELPSSSQRIASMVKVKLEKSHFAKFFLLFATMLGTSMVIGDGVLTPCISVLSAVGGIREATSSITEGTEALFADVGHFAVKSIQLSMCCVTYPALILAYTGQAAFLRKHNDLVKQTFFKSIPDPMYWPMFVVAILSSIVASQAMISGTFSIVQQSLSLGCFPRVKIVHTSAKYAGQVYIPEVNYLLMLACVAVTLAFRSTEKIGHAYGIAVVFVMTLTSAFLVLIMIMIWKTHILLVISYVLVIGSVELLYLSSVFYKFDQGGYLPLAFAAVLMSVMYIWNDVHRRKYFYELDHKVSLGRLKEIAADTNLCRMPGLAMFYSELVQGIPPIFKHYVEHYVENVSCTLHHSVTCLCPAEERFLFRKLSNGENDGELDVEFVNGEDENKDVNHVDEEKLQEELEREIEALDQASRAGIVHLIGENEVVAGKGAGIAKRFLINYAFNFLKKNLRQTENVFEIPHKRMLKVGMTYEHRACSEKGAGA